MRKRDLAILMLASFTIIFSLQHKGNFSFREAWMHLSNEYLIKFESKRLPPPIVTYLNGNSKKEVLIATPNAKIQVLEPHSRHVDEGFSDARVLEEVSLLPEKVCIALGRCAMAMAVSVVDRERPGQKLKQVLVVVTVG